MMSDSVEENAGMFGGELMNNWQIVGFIFLGFGMVVLLGGLFYAVTVGSVTEAATGIANSFGAAVPTQMSTIVFMFAFAPFAIGSAVCFVISAFGLIAGSKQKRQALAQAAPMA